MLLSLYSSANWDFVRVFCLQFSTSSGGTQLVPAHRIKLPSCAFLEYPLWRLWSIKESCSVVRTYVNLFSKKKFLFLLLAIWFLTCHLLHIWVPFNRTPDSIQNANRCSRFERTVCYCYVSRFIERIPLDNGAGAAHADRRVFQACAG